MQNIPIKDRITELKQIRSENSLTIQQIYNMIEASGDPLSMTTVKKIFADGSEEMVFSDRTIRQVERVLRGIYGWSRVEPSEIDLIEELRSQNQFMRDIIIEMNGQMRLLLETARVSLWQS